MTRDEAIEILDHIPTIGEQVDAIDMAIEALSEPSKQVTGKLKKPCDSLLADDLAECKEQKSKLEPSKVVGVEYSPYRIQETSAFADKPQGTKTIKVNGHGIWVEDERDKPQGKWIDAGQYPFDKCSICGQTVDSYDKWNYCPNCGAKMEGPGHE